MTALAQVTACDCSRYRLNLQLFGVGECDHTRAAMPAPAPAAPTEVERLRAEVAHLHKLLDIREETIRDLTCERDSLAAQVTP